MRFSPLALLLASIGSAAAIVPGALALALFLGEREALLGASLAWIAVGSVLWLVLWQTPLAQHVVDDHRSGAVVASVVALRVLVFVGDFDLVAWWLDQAQARVGAGATVLGLPALPLVVGGGLAALLHAEVLLLGGAALSFFAWSDSRP